MTVPLIRPTLAALAIALGFTLMSAAQTRAQDVVTLQSRQNGAHVCLQGGYYAARCTEATAARFELRPLPGGRVAFFDVALRQYLSAGLAGGQLIGPAPDGYGPDVTFDIEQWDGATYLRSATTGQFVRAGIGQETRLGAVSPHMRGWEAFTLAAVSAAPPQADPAPGPGPVPAPEVPDRLARLAGDWLVIRLQGANRERVWLDPTGARLFVMEDGRFSADLGCNRLLGAFRLTERGIALEGVVASTRRDCPAEGHARDRAFIEALEAVTRYEFDARTRLLIDANGVGRIELRN